MAKIATDTILDIEAAAHPWEDPKDLQALMDSIGSARFVLLGEASHGTSEYYAWRARISERLIEEKGFSFIAVEGDWPDCYRINRYIKFYDDAGKSAEAVLSTYKRWPTWIWANREMTYLIEWLRNYNAEFSEQQRAGFYGLDVYSLWDSIHAVVEYLEKADPAAAEQAKEAYRCFEPFGDDEQLYAYHTAFVPKSCEAEVIKVLELMHRNTHKYEKDYEAAFSARQNALVAANAEHYYRTMFKGNAASWNIRDHHMHATLSSLMKFYGSEAKAIIWAHNTHVGDARYTDMTGNGMVNIGQLVREAHPEDETFLVGFSTHRGTVVASTFWDGPTEVMEVPPARNGSWENLMHQAIPPDKLILSRETASKESFWQFRDQRAIGVVYNPEREGNGNYVPTLLPERYDAFIHIDETQALHPLHPRKRTGVPSAGDDLPETYPWGY